MSILHWAHNLVYWFFLIPFVAPMSYRTGFTPAQYYAYPLSAFPDPLAQLSLASRGASSLDTHPSRALR